MEYIVKELHLPEEDDEPNFVYSELDSGRLETRRVEFYPNGICFAYGGDMGHEEVLNPEPFPENLRELNHPGEVEVRSIPRRCSLRCGRRPRSGPTALWGCSFKAVPGGKRLFRRRGAFRHCGIRQIGIWRESRYMNVLLYLGIFWTIYGLAGLLGWQRINNKYKGYDWTKKYIRCLGISWLMLGIPCLIFSRLYEAGYNTRSMFVLMCFCMLPSLIFTIVVEKKFNAKIKDTQR